MKVTVDFVSTERKENILVMKPLFLILLVNKREEICI